MTPAPLFHRARAWHIAGALVALCVLVCLPGRAQAGTGSYRVAGQLVNALTGEPVARATVSLLSEDDDQVIATVLSNADGNFSIPNLAAGKYPLMSSRRGFRTSFFDEHEGFSSAIVTGPGQDTEHLIFRMPPSAVLRGVVTEDSGDAVEGASVLLFRHTADSGQRMVQSSSTTTDDTGAYEFDDLDPATYWVAVKAVPWYAHHRGRSANRAAGENSVDVAYPVTFFESTTDERSATPVVVSPAGRMEANIVLNAVPALHMALNDSRMDAGEVPAGNLSEVILGVEVPAQADAIRGADGKSFEFAGLAPGHYELIHGDPPRVLNVNAASSLDVSADAGAPMTRVSGRIGMSNGGPVPPLIDLVLQPVDSSSAASPIPAAAHKGIFRFDSVAPGRWRIAAQVAGQAMQVVAMRSGAASSTGDAFSVGEQPIDVDVIVSSAKTRVQGVAQIDGKPAPGAMILLVPLAASAYPDLARRDQSDSDGSFSLRDVPAGQYTVIAIQDGWALDWTQRANIERYLPAGESITVPETNAAILRLPAPVAGTRRNGPLPSPETSSKQGGKGSL